MKISNLQAFVALAVTTVFGLGFCPIAPGTIGSFVASFFTYLFLDQINITKFINFSLVISCLIAIPFIEFVLKHIAPYQKNLKKKNDPSYIVIDEVIGQFLSFSVISLFFRLLSIHVILSFIAFRFFDIFKPWPIRQIERKLGEIPSYQALGVVTDDIIAGILAGGSVIIFCTIFL